MKNLGAARTADERAVSNTIAVVLLFGIAIIGALLVVTLGGSAADEVRQQNDMEVAQQSMQDLSNRLAALKTGGDRTASFAFPDGMQGDTEVLHTTTINLTAYGENACTTGDVDIATLAYENSDGELVGYEAGGVWRSYPDGGSTMVSPPEINYRNGRLQLSMSDIEGQMSSRVEAQPVGDAAVQREPDPGPVRQQDCRSAQRGTDHPGQPYLRPGGPRTGLDGTVREPVLDGLVPVRQRQLRSGAYLHRFELR
jgi:type II secretory pathway pseudopilin PulG